MKDTKMVSISMEDHMSVDAVFVKAVEKLAKEKNLNLRDLAHKTLKLSTTDISIRELRRIMTPDYKGRARALSLQEAYELSRYVG